MKFPVLTDNPMPEEIEANNVDEAFDKLEKWFQNVRIKGVEDLPKDYDLGYKVGEAMDFFGPAIQYEGLRGDGLAHCIKEHLEEKLDEDGVIVSISLRDIKKAIAEFEG